MPQKAGVLGLVGIATALTGIALVTAEAGQSRGQLVVSAFVMVSATISTALSSPAQIQSVNALTPGTVGASPSAQNAPAVKTAAAASAPAVTRAVNTPAVCASIVVSCSGEAPMRVNAEGAAESAIGGGRCGADNRAGPQTFGLCGNPTTQSNALAITIEY